METKDRIVIALPPDEIRALNTDAAAEQIACLVADKNSIKRLEGKLVFDFEPWFSDGREPAENSDLRTWFFDLDERYPYLSFFLARDRDDDQIPVYTSMFVPFTVEGDTIRFDRQELERFAVRKIQQVYQFCVTNGIDSRENIRQFCEKLNLQVLDELDEERRYPFDPEPVSSRFLLEFFKTGYYYHTIDNSDEPVLFALVDNPVETYYAEMETKLSLYTCRHFPVIILELLVRDIPDNPLNMSFLFNVDMERHRLELDSYRQMRYINLNVLFRKENGELTYGFTRLLPLSDDLRANIGPMVQQATQRLRAIPQESRSFSRAVEKLFSDNPADSSLGIPVIKDTPAEMALPGQHGGEDAEYENYGSERDGEEQDERETKEFFGGDLELKNEDEEKEEEEQDEDEAENASADTDEDDENEDGEPDDDEEPSSPLKAVRLDGRNFGKKKVAVADESDDDEIAGPLEADVLEEIPITEIDRTSQYRRRMQDPYEPSLPDHILPESIQKITKALSRPMRRPTKEIQEALTVPQGRKTVMARNEDPVENMSRRLLILENKLDQKERECKRLEFELEQCHERMSHLDRQNLLLEKRWWKIWK